MKFNQVIAACLIGLAAAGSQAVTVTGNSASGTALAQKITGTGVTITDAKFFSDGTESNAQGAQAGFFESGGTEVGFETGIVLTNGVTSCVQGPNSSGQCGVAGNGFSTRLAFDFTSNTNKLFFQYVFASEEYNEFVGTTFNDNFQLLLDGVNIAKIGSDAVSVNTVNCGVNSGSYRNNADGGGIDCDNLGLNIQYDGLTVVLTASATLTGNIGDTHTFEFLVEDLGDTQYDSAVFIKEGSFSAFDPDAPTGGVPEPTSLALAGLALLGLAGARRRRSA